MSSFTTRPELLGTHGMVASTHWLASAAGMAILEAGGNAFDAAAAAGFVLQVVEPHLCGPGGEVPILLHSATDAPDVVHVVCGQGVAPAAATLEHYRDDLGLDLVPGSGLLAATVPGAIGGWLLMLERWGQLQLRDILTPAIGYAEDGWPLLPSTADALAMLVPLYQREWPTSAALWLDGNDAPSAGARWRNPDLAATYRRLLAEAEAGGRTREAQVEAARRAWYAGFVAETIAEFCASSAVWDTTGERHAGLLTGDDLAGWRATVEAPVRYDIGSWTVCKAGPWTQGPVFLQQLGLAEGTDLLDLDPLGADFVHRVVEGAKLAFADREAWYADPAHVDVPLESLLAPAYADERRPLIGDTASANLRPGAPGGRSPELPAFPVDGQGGGGFTTARRSRRERNAGRQPRGLVPSPADVFGAEPVIDRGGRSRGDTSHVDVVDRAGNIVSATPSGGWLQSSPTIPGLGFCLGSRAEMFWLDPRVPGVIASGKRPRTTLTPSLALRDGRAHLAFGTPGGDQQDQWSFTFFLRHLAGLGLQEAVDAPTFHSEHMPSSFWPRTARPNRLVVEDRFGTAVIEQLRRRGHEVVVVDGWSLGRVSAAAYDGPGGWLRAAANPRAMQGYAVGR